MNGSPEGFLPYGRQQIDDDDVAAVADALRGDFLTTGPHVARFEDALTRLTGAGFAVACANGTAALHLATLAARLGPGDAVIVPSVTFLATANAARYVGAEVVFADVDPETGLMSAETLSAALRRVPHGLTARAVMPVHLRGTLCDMPAIGEAARRASLLVIEDAAHALGSTTLIDGQRVAAGGCEYSAMTCFSFHPVKTIAMGEGGAVTTSDPALDKRLRRMRSHGMTNVPVEWSEHDQGFAGDVANPWYYEMPEPGFNYRLTDIQCALGLSQMCKLQAFVTRRADLANRYDALLAALGSPHLRPHAPAAAGEAPAWHIYAARIDFEAFGVTRGEVMRRLRAVGIGSQVHYVPVHRQPYYSARYGALDLPGAERYYARALSLPLFPAMADSDVDRVVTALAKAVGVAGG